MRQYQRSHQIHPSFVRCLVNYHVTVLYVWIFDTYCNIPAPSTPASDRKCIDKFCNSETSNESRTTDKKKAKRVSIAKEEDSDKGEGPEVNNNDKDSENKKGSDLNHHSHLHRNHSHGHIHPKRRMSLDNTTVSTQRSIRSNLDLITLFEFRIHRSIRTTARYVTIQPHGCTDTSQTDRRTRLRKDHDQTAISGFTVTRAEHPCLKGTATA